MYLNRVYKKKVKNLLQGLTLTWDVFKSRRWNAMEF